MFCKYFCKTVSSSHTAFKFTSELTWWIASSSGVSNHSVPGRFTFVVQRLGSISTFTHSCFLMWPPMHFQECSPMHFLEYIIIENDNRSPTYRLNIFMAFYHSYLMMSHLSYQYKKIQNS
jgi:hypothetical protein